MRLAGKTPREQLKILREGAEQFETWATDPKIWPISRFGEEQAQILQVAQVAASQARAAGAVFSVPAFLASLRGRGAVVTLENGGICVSPAVVLNEVDRRQMRDHRSEIIAGLSDKETF